MQILNEKRICIESKQIHKNKTVNQERIFELLQWNPGLKQV